MTRHYRGYFSFQIMYDFIELYYRQHALSLSTLEFSLHIYMLYTTSRPINSLENEPGNGKGNC